MIPIKVTILNRHPALLRNLVLKMLKISQTQYPKKVSSHVYFLHIAVEQRTNAPERDTVIAHWVASFFYFHYFIFTYSPSSSHSSQRHPIHLPVSLCWSLFSLSLPLWCLCHILTASFLSFPTLFLLNLLPPSVSLLIPSYFSWCHWAS